MRIALFSAVPLLWIRVNREGGGGGALTIFFIFYKIRTTTTGQITARRNMRVLSRYNEIGLTNKSARISFGGFYNEL